jgi:hypothetical protein
MSLTKIRKSNIESNVQLPHANAAFDTANSSGVYANAAFAVANSAAAGSVDSYARNTANSASSYANGAFAAANNAVDTWVRDAANSASSYANSAYSQANNKLSLSGGTLTGNLVVGGNVMPTTDNTYFLGSETARWHSLYVGDGSIYIGDIVLSNDANKLAITDPVGNKVTISSNNIVLGDFVLSSSGAITGDVIITGNLKVTGTTADLEVTGLIVDDNIIDINEATLGAPTLNAGLRVKRGDENPVLLRWNETTDRWEYTNEGTVYSNIGSAAAETYANAAYALANTKLSSSGGTIDGNLSVTGNLIISGNTTTVDVETLRVTDPIILLANSNTQDLVDIGFTAHYGATEKHTGLIRHAPTQEYYLFDNYDGHILHQNNSVNISNADFRIVTLHANLKSNSVIVRGHDALSHTNLSFDVANAASSYANSAFLRANTPSDTANTAGVYANAAYNQANTATTNAAQADQRSVTSGSYANSGYALANTANTLAQSAYDAANNAVDTWVRDAANSASSYANSGFGKANTANILAQSAYDAANNATDTWVRNAANSASSYANSGYDTANSAGVYANAAFAAANTGGGAGTDDYARDTANSAGVYANAAFAAANTGGASSNSFYVNIVHDSFVASGSEDTFTLSTEPIDENYTLVTINGIVQHKNAYSVSSANLVLSESPAANSEIDVVSYTRIGAGAFNLSIVLDTFNGDGTTNTFSLSTSPVNENYTSVVIDGVAQLKTSYNVSGSNLIFAESPDSGANIDVTIYTSVATEENIKIGLAYDHANAAYDAANNAVDTWVRDAANSASSYANAAYEQANTGGGGASAARAMTMAILFG